MAASSDLPLPAVLLLISRLSERDSAGILIRILLLPPLLLLPLLFEV